MATSQINPQTTAGLIQNCFRCPWISNPDAVLCKDCERNLDNISKLTKCSQNIHSQVLQKLHALNRNKQTRRIARKRSPSCLTNDSHMSNSATSDYGATEASNILYMSPSYSSSLASDNLSDSTSGEQMTTNATLSTTQISPLVTVCVYSVRVFTCTWMACVMFCILVFDILFYVTVLVGCDAE